MGKTYKILINMVQFHYVKNVGIGSFSGPYSVVPISCQCSNLFQCFPLFCNVSQAITRICSITKDVLKNFSKFTGKHLCLRLSFGKVSGLKPATLLKKRLQSRNFPVNFEKFLRKHFFEEHIRVTILAFPGKVLR